jgi:hypothetical protein
MQLTIIDYEVKAPNEVEFSADLQLASSVSEIFGTASYIWKTDKYAPANPQDEGKAGFTFDSLTLEQATVMLESTTFKADEKSREILAESLAEVFTEQFVKWEELLLEQEEN